GGTTITETQAIDHFARCGNCLRIAAHIAFEPKFAQSMASPTAIAGYLLLFTIIGAGFIFGNLFLGRFLRPKAPNVEKLEVYECGEPTIGSSFVQFDLRFYVVALLFIIFDVEVAFFFPWANVFGKATNLMDPNFAAVQKSSDTKQGGIELTPD